MKPEARIIINDRFTFDWESKKYRSTPEQIQQDCQVVFAPPSVSGERLVPDRFSGVGADEEIRLTYRELTTLIEDAVRNLK